MFSSCFVLVIKFDYIFVLFLFYDVDLGLGMFLFLSWFRKSYELVCFCAHDSLNRLPPLGLHLCSFLFFVFNFGNMSMFRKVVASMKMFFAILQYVQQENQSLHDLVMHFQNNQVPTSSKYVPTTQIPIKEP